MDDLTLQYIKAVITIVLGVIGILLPRRFNPFQFKHRGTGKMIADLLSDKTKDRIPKVIGGLLIFTGLVVLLLTPILGPIPWE